MVQQIKDPSLSLQWLGSLCGAGSIPGPGTSTCPGFSPKKKKERERERMIHP